MQIPQIFTFPVLFKSSSPEFSLRLTKNLSVSPCSDKEEKNEEETNNKLTSFKLHCWNRNRKILSFQKGRIGAQWGIGLK
jgi:hypothetical protein